MAIEVRAIPLRRAAGFLVHVLTASGAAAAVAALTAAIDRDFPRCFARACRHLLLHMHTSSSRAPRLNAD